MGSRITHVDWVSAGTRIYQSDDDEACIAEVPSLPGCVSHGDSLSEAAAKVQEAVELWLEIAERHQDEIPEPDVACGRISQYGALLNVSELARRPGLKRTTLASKLQRKTKSTQHEIKVLRQALDTVAQPRIRVSSRSAKPSPAK